MVRSSLNVTPPVLTVTVAVPPFSAITPGSAVTAHSGVSSSVMVSVTAAGAATAGMLTVPDTVTFLSGAPNWSFTAVTVTVPVLSVRYAAKLSVVASLSVKSAAVAGSTGCAATVTVYGSVNAAVAVAVTRLTPPSSAIASGASRSVTDGIPSSSVIVTVRCSPIGSSRCRAVISIVSASSANTSSSAMMLNVT